MFVFPSLGIIQETESDLGFCFRMPKTVFPGEVTKYGYLFLIASTHSEEESLRT